jgi:hypothetical protein
MLDVLKLSHARVDASLINSKDTKDEYGNPRPP